MPTGPIQLILACLELGLILGGAGMLWWLAATAERRSRWLAPQSLPPWPVTLPEFVIFVFLLLGSGAFLQLAAYSLLKGTVAHATDREGLQLCLTGFGFDGGALLGWLLFRSMRKTWYADYGATVPAVPPTTLQPWFKATLIGGFTFLAAMPVLIIVNLGWAFFIKKLGLPDDPQDLIEIFANTKSPFVIAGMLIVACVLAPIFEELLFRGGLYRFCRQNPLGLPSVISLPFIIGGLQQFYTSAKAFHHALVHAGLVSLGISIVLAIAGAFFFYLAFKSTFLAKNRRIMSLVLSGCLFGAAHTNWASFLPLSIFGMVLALAYEATGDIRVPIIAHGLFNLNTVLIVLSGLPQ